jgi:hypothetical protein
VEDYEDEWEEANRVNRAYLRYKPVDVAGHQVPPPQRQAFAGVPAGLLQDMTQAEHDIQASVGMYSASIGQPSNERSGKAILARQREGDIGSYHYRDNLGRSIRHVGRIIVDLIPSVYDTRRVLRIVGEDGVDRQITLDPGARRPVEARPLLDGSIAKVYNPGLCKYDVSISTGPGYTTRRQEAAEAILQLSQNMPQLFGVVGDLLVKSMDWPYADEISRRLRVLLPAAIKETDGEQGPKIPPEVQAKISQLVQAMKLMGEKIKELGEENTKLKGIVDGKVLDRAMKQEEARVQLDSNEVERERLVVEKMKIEKELMAVLAQDNGELELKRDELALRQVELADKAEQNRMSHEAAKMKHKEALMGLGAKMMETEAGAGEGEEPGEEEEDVDAKTRQVVSELVQVVQGLQQSLEGVGQGLMAIEAKLEESDGMHEARANAHMEHMTRMIEGAQAMGVVPEYDEDGNIIGGTVVQRDGGKRQVNVGGRNG